MSDIADLPQSPAPTTGTALATLAGGCFWCLEAVYTELQGVIAVESGYCGGVDPHPTYESVCEGRTGHAEAVRIRFDPTIVDYETLLEIFFAIHDPTTRNRQGNDVGTQYRSAIFCHDAAQKAAATALVEQLARQSVFNQPIVTDIVDVEPWHRAENYHQNYFRDHPTQGYCTFVVGPKVAKFRKLYASRLK